MEESDEILTMRGMAWERAKGELWAYLQTYWNWSSGHYEEAEKRITAFIEEFEETCR